LEEEPVLYPVACNPQAWSAGSVFLLLKACLGLKVDASAGRIVFDRPALPPSLDSVKISGLRCGGSSANLLFSRHQDDVGVNVLKRDGPLEVIVIK
jgi:glycogen debranching enzyme